MEAGVLRCPNCGAPAAPELARCAHCSVRLQTVACPACFGMIFASARHCSHCGAAAVRKEASLLGGACPRCTPAKLALTHVGAAPVEECARCGGLWVEAQSFQKILDEQQHQAHFVGLGAPAHVPHAAVPEVRVRYVPCPRCQKIMNRVNFARCSGVIVDVCKGHGVWFDDDELRQIVEFVRAGGMAAAQTREREELESERRRLVRERLSAGESTSPEWGPAMHAARDLLDLLW